MKMYVANLQSDVTDSDLIGLFSEFGAVLSANIVMDKASRQSKGYGFVEMPNNSEADTAIKALNGVELKGGRIKISQSEPRRKRNMRRRRY